MKLLKKVLYVLWIVIALIVLGVLLVNPSFFSVDNLTSFIRQFESQLLLAYILFSCIRGLFLIPSTPLVLAGAVLFPDSPITVIIISMIGILFTTLMLYYYSDTLGFSKKLEAKFPAKMIKWKGRLQSKNAIWIVLLWSFFPFVPTDLICYVAGIVKMPLKYLLLGVLIGELILVSCYVLLGTGIFEWFMS
jgi:uncharacterized membrane protein YdjX (TVP38/TMEM64 family)